MTITLTYRDRIITANIEPDLFVAALAEGASLIFGCYEEAYIQSGIDVLDRYKTVKDAGVEDGDILELGTIGIGI